MEPASVKPKRAKTPDEALAALMRLCARAEKCSADARRLMHGWGLSAADAERVLARLEADRFIDDGRYAAAFVREKLRLSGWGAYKIRAALRRKQIDRRTIEEALAEALAGSDPDRLAERLDAQLQRKARTTKAAAPHELKAKLIRYGLSLGHDYEAVVAAAGRIVTTDNDDMPCDEPLF